MTSNCIGLINTNVRIQWKQIISVQTIETQLVRQSQLIKGSMSTSNKLVNIRGTLSQQDKINIQATCQLLALLNAYILESQRQPPKYYINIWWSLSSESSYMNRNVRINHYESSLLLQATCILVNFKYNRSCAQLKGSHLLDKCPL